MAWAEAFRNGIGSLHLVKWSVITNRNQYLSSRDAGWPANGRSSNSGIIASRRDLGMYILSSPRVVEYFA
ncbi:hypothetical protein TNCV_4575291 [Trichonephila clavipes]|nr:hypothetical protein TNCV_4575291 [Trichonephila clavipes]